MKPTIFRFKFIKATLIWTLLFGSIFTSCSNKDSTPPPAADKVALRAAIATAQGLVNNTVEGTKPGQYEVGFKAALNTALAASILVEANATATQALVDNTTAQLLAAIAAYQTHLITEIAPANLIGFWKFNGNPNDSSGKGNNGTLTTGHATYGAGNAVLTSDRFGRANKAYNFDHGGNIEVPYNASLNPQEMTVSLWAKKTTLGRTWDPSTYTMVAMNRWNGYKFQLQGGNLTFFTVKVNKAGGGTDIWDRDNAGIALGNNVWYHVAVTFKAGEMNFYINGDPVTSWTNTPGTAFTLTTPINFVIGQDLPTNKYLLVDGDFQVAWGGFWTGDMDDVMFYNKALTAPQVKSIYNNQVTL